MSNSPYRDLPVASTRRQDVQAFLLKGLARVATIAVPVFLLLPFIGVLSASFSHSGDLAFPPTDWSLRWYRSISADYYDALLYSLTLSTWTTLLAAAVGVPLAMAITRGKFYGRDAINALCVAPLGVPTIVVAVAGFKFFMIVTDYTDLAINGTSLGIVLLTAVFTLPLLVRSVVASFAHYDESLDEAAQNLGATPWQVFWRITVPIIAPGIGAGMLFVFVLSFDDVVVAWFMGDPSTPTLSVKLFTVIDVDFDNAITALSALIVITWAVLILVVDRFFRLERLLDRA